jgi:acetyl-CoA synthetase
MSESLSALSSESRRFDPPEALAASANVDASAYELAAKDRLAFWEAQAGRLMWDRGWDQVLDWQPPFAKWFVGGQLNVSVNCLDRHVDAGLGDRVAYHWVGEPEGDRATITYRELLERVSQAAHALTELDVRAMTGAGAIT